MMEQLSSFLVENLWLRKLIAIAVAFLLAYGVHLASGRLTGRLVDLNRFAADGRRLSPERKSTLHGLIASAISLLAFIVAIIFSVSRFVDAQTVVWMVGLFSAAFGLGARPLVNDFLAGASFIFEDTYGVGEKVEILGVEGVIERVTLRVTIMRAPSGELLVVPNGDIRIVRNYSRGRFSTVTLKMKVVAEDLSRALELLEGIGEEAVMSLPNLLEPWQVISESGAIGERTELTLVTKARFGHGAELRPRLLAFVQQRLAEEGIALTD